MSHIIRTLAALTAVCLLAIPAGAAGTTVVVAADGDAGWTFNPDPGYVTPFDFTTAEESIGSGSLAVAPITNSVSPSDGDRDKFIGALGLGVLVSDYESVSFDFKIDDSAGATAAKANQFYLNVYTNLPDSSTFYDCRFDFVAGSGSTTAFNTVTGASGDTATAVGDRGGDDFTCPATIAGMPAGSTVSFFSLNVGDTSANDQNVGGWLDNVVVDMAGGTTVYDFEDMPEDKDECKKGGWEAFGFRNQGQCIRYVNTGADSR